MRRAFKNSRWIFFFIFIALGWVHFDIFYFGHCHVSNGEPVIYHAHPFDKHNQTSPAFPDHTHSRKESIELATILEAVSLSFFAVVVLCFFFLLKKKELLRFFQFLIVPRLVFCTSIMKRGPPLRSLLF